MHRNNNGRIYFSDNFSRFFAINGVFPADRDKENVYIYLITQNNTLFTLQQQDTSFIAKYDYGIEVLAKKRWNYSAQQKVLCNWGSTLKQ